MTSTTIDADVIVSGAGPVGLFLSAELALRGIRVIVLERLTEQSQAIKAGAISGRTTQLLDRRGLGPRLTQLARESGEGFAAFAGARSAQAQAQGVAADAPPRRRFDGHFAGIFLHADPDLPVPASTVLPQQALEVLLMEHAMALGVRILRGYEVIGLEQHGESVTVHADRDGGPVILSGSYLVGCDGGRSAVRKLAGFDFPGTPPLTTGYQAIVDLEDPAVLPMGWFATGVGLYVHGPQPGRLLTVCFDGPPADRFAPITPEELQDNLRHVSGTEATITTVHASTRYTDNVRQASTYRQGRIFLAGDAAHIHPPYGGQGLNTGIQDAANLGWKLAATLHGRAAEGLLDSYTAERHPVAERVLLNTRAQVALLRPDPLDRSMRDLFAQLLETTPALADSVVRMLQGLDIRYDMGIAGHPLIGTHMPEIDGLDEAMSGGGWVLASAAGSELTPPVGLVDQIVVLRGTLPSDAAAILIRPDGYIAWAATTPDARALELATARWFAAAGS